MTNRFDVIACSSLTTLQDRGRPGWMRYGIPASGPMDWVSMRIANALVGNPPDSPCLEVGLGGLSLRSWSDGVCLAVTGGGCFLRVNGRVCDGWTSHWIYRGDRVDVIGGGMWRYLAVSGGFMGDRVLGSVSSSVVGRGAFRTGDTIELTRSVSTFCDRYTLPSELRPLSFSEFHVVPGPQDDWFSQETLATFYGSWFEISLRLDRMGYWLEGPCLSYSKGGNFISDPVALGSIQVSGSGRALILMADRGTTGGYPKIATVIGHDLPFLVQKRPREFVRFKGIGVELACERYVSLCSWLECLPLVVVRGDSLSTNNLISGVIDAYREEF